MGKLKKKIRNLLPARINRVYARTLIYTAYYSFHNRLLLSEKRRLSQWCVAFIVMTHTMWKEDDLYSLFACDKRFRTILILAPSCRIYIGDDEFRRETQRMKDYFSTKGYVYLTYEEFCNNPINIDVAFYQQPYEDGCLSFVSPLRLKNTLACYIPYSIPTLYLRYDYEHLLMNIAWKMFYPTMSCKKMVEELSINKKNVEVSGYPSADILLDNENIPVNYWNTNKKHIIWAPHHSISEKNQNIHQSTFLLYSDFMIELTKRYHDEIEVAFNPHPLLFESLKYNAGWTDDDIDNYIHKWKMLDNAIVTLDNYMDVFKTSDALIHDCASFTIEYMYTGKPALFLCKNGIGSHQARLNALAAAAFAAHYKATCTDDIERFLTEVLLQGKDPKKSERESVLKDLIPPYGNTASRNIYESVSNALQK